MSVVSLVTLAQISKRFGSQKLFNDLSFAINQRDRVGLIGPNGKGKSTLLKIIAGEEEEDSGTIFRQRDLRIVHIAQTAKFLENKSAFEVVHSAASAAAISEAESLTLAYRALAEVGFEDDTALVSTLSGGQRKKLQIACGICSAPDLLLLDEPTNHLDIGSIISLEAMLSESNFAWVAVSHDRFFLENAVNKIAEINPRYPNGIFVCEGSYSQYLIRSEEFLASEQSRQSSLENKVRTEQAWLRRGAKARTTKSKSRSNKAYEMMDSLSLIRQRNREHNVDLAFSSSERQTKKLVEMTNVSLNFGDRKIVSGFSMKIMAGETIGLLGRNGVGKSSLMKLISGEVKPTTGTIKTALNLKIAQFKQIDESILETTALKEVLADDSDEVIFRNKAVHVTSWASRFGFAFSQLNQSFGSLSGGEKARARISRIMRESPDILLLDEPTNDLDIQTLEMLEQSLSEFDGALVLVTHDRFMINRLCSKFVGLDGEGNFTVVADYEQWERELTQPVASPAKAKIVTQLPKSKSPNKSNLSSEQRKEYNQIESKIVKADARVASIQELINAQQLQNDVAKLEELWKELAAATQASEELYQRWHELEQLLTQ